MLALKKKREAEKKAAEEAAKIEASNGGTPGVASPAGGKGVSLFGVGGVKKKTKKGEQTGAKKTPGEIRIQKDIGELDGGKVATVNFPKVNDLINFNVVIKPDSGYWEGATYQFVFNVPTHYPHSPPKVFFSMLLEVMPLFIFCEMILIMYTFIFIDCFLYLITSTFL
mmetsp:Transcript_14520/g.14382  ORF Transcript_14520/g.14382 Transcript_14520/m.14382 type:complete len:168 (-) Transcript_14520:646-1149(-)